MIDSNRALGEELNDLVRSAEREVVLVSPFMKKDILDRLLTNVADNVFVTCFTRWRLNELAIGVSDISIWDSISRRPNSALYLITNLHAKYFRGDSKCLFGSANLTAAGLGWSKRPNLELLEAPSSCSKLTDSFEKGILDVAIIVDEDIYFRVKNALDECSSNPMSFPFITDYLDDVNNDLMMPNHLENWLPQLRHPQDLFLVYSGKLHGLSTVTKKLGLEDLSYFTVYDGMTRKIFEAEIGVQLLQKRMIKRIDSFLVNPKRFGEGKRYLSAQVDDALVISDPAAAWQTVIRWLMYFLPDRYHLSVPKYTEVIYRVK